MMTDIIADSLTRIRNAAQRKLETTELLHSKMIEAIVSILVEKGYLESYLHGGTTTSISASEVHVPGRPSDPEGVKALAVAAHKRFF
jgi:ribosomal protein S8